MTEEQFKKMLEIMTETIDKKIESKVNGKIDSMRLEFTDMREEMRNHMKEVEPFLEGWRGGKQIGRLIKWTAGLIIAVAGATAIIMNIK